MVRKIVIWSDTAVFQRRSIFRYWNKRNKSTNYSNRLRILINKRIIMIQANPESFLMSEFEDNHVTVIEHFLLFYRVLQNEILITSFWDSRQNPDKLLQLLRD